MTTCSIARFASRGARGVAILGTSLLAPVWARASIPVFGAGRAPLPVIVAADAAPAERRAAEELANVLGAMSGLKWPERLEGAAEGPAIFVGRTRESDDLGFRLKASDDLLTPGPGEVEPDAFMVRSSRGSVFIVGATPGATMDGVFWLLGRESGVRWFAPGLAGRVVPARTGWTLPDIDVVVEPAFVSRELYGMASPDEKDWAVRNGLGGHLRFSHALEGVFSPESVADHPDWAPLLQGARYRPAGADDGNWQPNLALGAVSARAAAAAAVAFSRDPEERSFSLAINDTVRFDQGPETRALVEPLRYFRGRPDYSPLVFSFMNRAADSLDGAFPGRYLGCLAYFWCENVPPFRVNPRVVPFVTGDRSQYYDPAYRREDLELMSRWQASGVRAYGVWDYAYGRDFLVPREPNRALADALREAWRRGARGYFAEADPDWGFDAFKCWMLGRLLWEPGRPYGELADEFYRGYYGPAASPMRMFFERCEEQWMSQPGPAFWLKFYRQEDQALLFPPAVCGELRALLDKAAGSVGQDDVLAARVVATSAAFSLTEAYVAFDGLRRSLAARGDEDGGAPVDFARTVDGIRGLALLRKSLYAAYDGSRGKRASDAAPAELEDVVRNDPVPRLLLLAGRRDPTVPSRMLEAAGVSAGRCVPWRALACVIASGALGGAPDVEDNAYFLREDPEGEKPRFLYPNYGALPAGWVVRAMPTQAGRVSLVSPAEGPVRRALRIEGAWDTQVYQWKAAKPGFVYVATGRLRGISGPGGDEALFLTFLDSRGKVAGEHRMQSLPKGLTSQWRTMALADIAPAGTAWVGFGIGSARQEGGDWLEAAELRLRCVKP